MKLIHSPNKQAQDHRLGSRLGLPTVIQSVALALTLLSGSMAIQDRALADSGKTLATGSGLALAQNAPDQYTVKSGDTLWDIAKTYLNQPWYWPELWYLNPQIQNPHLIYPGDVLQLVTVDGKPRLTLASRGGSDVSGGNDRVVAGGAVRLSPQVRSEDMGNAISTISYRDISAFLGRPTVLTKSEVASGPHLLSRRDSHVVGAAGDQFYVVGAGNATRGARYNVMHVEEALKDPETGHVLGYRAAYVGNGPILTEGDPAKMQLAESVREALAGDRVFPDAYQLNTNFVPHAPPAATKGSIFAVADGTISGRFNVVAINRGTKAGLEPGHVLAILKKGETVVDRYTDGRSANPMETPSGAFKQKIKLPDERIGLAMVFKTYENMSYVLIMDADQPVDIGDLITNP